MNKALTEKKKYIVRWTEYYSKEVEADSAEEAETLALETYDRQNDYHGTDVTDTQEVK